MYDACAEAILKGSKINEIYSNGEEFCKSRRYNIDDVGKDKCFYYQVEAKINSASSKFNINYWSILVISLFFYYS